MDLRMRKNIIIISQLYLITVSIGLTATINIKKTFVMHRPKIDNMAIEKSGIHKYSETKTKYDFNNFHLQTTPFISEAIKGANIGKYYGVNGTNVIDINNASDVIGAAEVIASNTIDIWDRFLIHSQNGIVNQTLHGNFEINPKQEAYGIRFDLFGCLKKRFHKIFYKLSMPLVHIENSMHIKYNHDVPDIDGDKISEFFIGNKLINGGVARDLQAKLTAGKIQDHKKTVSGIADIDAHIGYRLVENKKHKIKISALITVPTGNKPKGEYLFEPIFGNGKHFAVGWNIDGTMRLWKRKRNTGIGYFSLTHKYLFDGTEQRVIPLNLMSYPFAHYYLGGKMDQAGTTPLFPLANILNQNVRVHPGNLVEALVAFKFRHKRFDLDAGYNLFYKEKENVTLKKEWIDNKYAIANTNYDTSGIFRANEQLLAINKEHLNINGAATPNQLTDKIFGAISYKFKFSGHPANISLGGSYEFAYNDFELEGYEFWFKTGINF